MNYSNFGFKQVLTKICLLLFFSCNVFAQQNLGKIKGVITTSEGELAVGVNIILKNSKYSTISNEDGAFEFNRLKSNRYTLQVSLTGYETVEKQITVTADETTIINLKLTVSNKELKEVFINANRGKSFPKQSNYVSKMPLKNIENPQVYNIVSSELMKEQAITNYEDALKNVPGIQKLWESTGRGGDGGSYYSLRGFEVQANMVNGLPGLTSGTLDPANIERIEVIKGPSGTLFGSSLVSYGGLINTVTKKPYSGFGGEVSYLTGSFGLNRATVDLNTSLDKTNSLLFRINSSFQTENSFQDAGFRTSYFIAPSLSYKVNERLSFLVNTEFMTEEKTTPSMLFLGRDAPLQFANLAELNYNTNLSFYSNDLPIKNPRFNLQAHMNYKISSKWTSQTVYSRGTSKSKGYYSYIYDNEDGNGDFALWITNENSQTATTDIQQNFIGDVKIGPMRNRIVAGLDYFKRDVTFRGTGYGKLYNLTPQGEIRQFDNLNPNYLTVASVDNLLAAEPGPDYQSKDATYSAYVSDVLNIFPTFMVMASLRVDYFDTEGNVKTDNDNYTQTALSPKFGVVYQPIKDQLSVFANYMNGFKNIAPSAIYDNNGNFIGSQTFKPEHANQLEAGVKTDLFSDKLTTTISYYTINVANLVTSNPMYSAQGGEARSNGFEVDLNASPIKGLSIIAGYSYNDSKITKGDENNVWLDQGKRPFWAGPKNLINFWTSYKFDEGLLENFGLGFGGNYASDNAILDSEVTGKFILPSYTVLNSSVFYNATKFRISLNVNNITNKDYFNGGWSTVNPQKPRNVVASFAYKF
ncbi:TonB-dependent receptor [Flavobacterium quisquiliarum]|uniref:TonB-dependent siderophore receptor n=1 Tax=Flavobacterium quisquiliarum TaxID=1834436 RepID=A0ABV8W8V4_9FLAO|nr:TonB-dependent receptor [Flavobacterium quisquiliarum]MBW1656502.1 TonB-dependent siderophore receptor [Flavobacterium quisquiliarum]NWL03829.1 TonB-dependent siderophore receptor [Flavobacterium collinsii]